MTNYEKLKEVIYQSAETIVLSRWQPEDGKGSPFYLPNEDEDEVYHYVDRAQKEFDALVDDFESRVFNLNEIKRLKTDSSLIKYDSFFIDDETSEKDAKGRYTKMISVPKNQIDWSEPDLIFLGIIKDYDLAGIYVTI